MNDVVSEKRREGKPLIKFKPLLLLYNLMMSTSALKFLLLLLILGSVYAQDDAAQALVDANPELLAVLNNYFGCSKWDNQLCLECSKGYFFNEKGICCEVSPQCRIFNQAQGIC